MHNFNWIVAVKLPIYHFVSIDQIVSAGLIFWTAYLSFILIYSVSNLSIYQLHFFNDYLLD
jgi:hypothetical protein